MLQKNKAVNHPIILFYLFLILSIIGSCKKEEPLLINDDPLTRKEDTLKNYSPDVRFDITRRLLQGKRIDCIEPDYKGNIWISSGKELFYFKGSEEMTYVLDFPILDISIAGDETLWIGTNGGGLGHLTVNGFEWFTMASSGLPRDYISNVEAGLDGRVWFSSCAHDLGGLLVYDGKKFSLFTPENSILNQNVIDDIGIDHNGAIYIITSGKVGKASVFRISENSMECLGYQTGTFYWVSAFTVGPAGIIYLLEDFGLSSSNTGYNTIHRYMDKKWNPVAAGFMTSRLSFFTAIKADRRNYCWAASIDGNKYILHVYNGQSWQEPPENVFLGDKITTIEADNDNNIWIGTSKNGLFILKQ